ncbi:hypothetical protein F511_42715 [Dorcoceras hygrometricum]|uniref:Uncharacterized protein n=1 Tax=Dorcoceras hygrometricum TaxID=472368 RepID=A0A2Z7A6S6_9LAMI|nr:hypothetical protein F511_42715 [Dorcoceras hygrometricum]
MPNCTDSSDYYPRNYVQLGSVFRGEYHASKSPTSIRLYASPSLNYEITENRGENLAQDTHQSRSNLRWEKCPQRIERRAKSPARSKAFISST